MSINRRVASSLSWVVARWLVAALAIGVLAPGWVALAQDLPPFPAVYGGRAFLDGVPLEEGSRLVARVGDYENWTTVEKGGVYRNLVVGPPTRDYFNKPVTFHALGLKAEEEDLFGAAISPVFNDQGFDLHFLRTGAEPGTPVATAAAPTATEPARRAGDGAAGGFASAWWVVGSGAILAVLGGMGGWLLLRVKRSK